MPRKTQDLSDVVSKFAAPKQRKYKAYDPLSKENVPANIQETRPIIPLMQPIPKTNIKIHTELVGTVIHQRDTLLEHVERIIDLREKGIRDKLIEAGWTPPDDKPTLEKYGQSADLGVTAEEIVGGCSKDADVDTTGMPGLNHELLSRALKAICLTRDYAYPNVNLPAIEGWTWYDVGTEIARAIPFDEWAIQFRSRVAIDQHHRMVADQLRNQLALGVPECATPMFSVLHEFLELMGFTQWEQDKLIKCNYVRIVEEILDDQEMAKAFDEHEVE